MEPSNPSPRASLLQRRLVAVAAAALLLTAVVGALAGVFLLAPPSSSTASASLVAAGASATATDTSSPTSSAESASPSSSENPTASATATAAAVTPKPATPTPAPTMIVLKGSFALSAKAGWAATGVLYQSHDILKLSATGTYKVGSSDPGRTPGGVGCTGASGGTGFLVPNLTKFAVVFKIIGVTATPGCLGASTTFSSPLGASGELVVAVNDDYYNDNSGTITINWEIDRQP